MKGDAVLTLADSRRLPHATVYRDVSWADGTRALTPQFYVLADEPVLAATGTASGYTYYRYRGAPGSTEAGGLLVLSARLGDPGASADAVRAAYGLAADVEVRVASPPVSAAAGRVSLGGESGAGEFVSSVSCSTDASSGGITVVAVLTADGAALVDQAMEHGLAVVHVETDLSLDYVLDDVELTVWCDASAADELAHDLAAAGQGTAADVAAELVARHLAGSTLVSARPLSPDEQAAVDALSAQVLQGVVLPRLLGEDGSPRSGALRQRSSLTLTASAPGVLALTRSATLALPDGPASTVSADLGSAGLRRVVRVGAAGDLAARGVALVEVSLDYAGDLPDGTVLRRTADLVLRPGQPAAVATFDIASPDQRAVSAHVVVHFADGSAPYAFDLPATTADDLDLDVDAMGVVAVDVGLVGVEPGVPAQAIVEFAYGPSEPSASARIVLDGAVPTGRWVAVVREPPRAYRYRVTWVEGADRTDGDWQESAQPVLRLEPPFAAPTGTVTVISAGAFDQLSALVVELQAAEDQPVTTLSFTAPDQTRSWTTTPGADYAYRTTLVRPDGSHPAGPSGSTDLPVLLVRDTLRFDVTVVPVLLGVGADLTRAVVELESPDPAAAHTTLVFDPPAAPARAALRLTDPAVHDYRYRLTLCPPSVPPRVGDWQSGSSAILVPRRAS